MLQIAPAPQPWIFHYKNESGALLPFLAEFVRDKVDAIGFTRTERYQAPAVRVAGENRMVYVVNGRPCFIESSHLATNKIGEWSTFTEVVVRFLDDGSREEMPAGKFRKLKPKPATIRSAA